MRPSPESLSEIRSVNFYSSRHRRGRDAAGERHARARTPCARRVLTPMRAKGDMHFQQCAYVVAYDEKNGLSWMLMTTFASTKCSFEDLRFFGTLMLRRSNHGHFSCLTLKSTWASKMQLSRSNLEKYKITW